MTTIYPNGIDTLDNCENDAVLAIETKLGINPQGNMSTVGARIAQLEDHINYRTFRMQDFASPQNAIDAAHDAGGGVVVVPWGITMLTLNPTTRRFLNLRSGVSIVGYGPQSILKVPDGAGNYQAIIAADGETCDDLTLSGFCIDGNQAGNAPTSVNDFEPSGGSFAAPRFGVLLATGARPTISNLYIKSLDGLNTIWSQMDDTEVSGCKLEPITTFDHDHATIYTHCVGQRIVGNVCFGNTIMRSALETHGDEQMVAFNTVRKYKKGMSLTGVSSHGSFGATIVHNQFLDMEAGINVWAQTYTGGDPVQAFRAIIIDRNIVRLNKTLWPAAALVNGVCLYAIGQEPLDIPQGQNIVQIIE